MARPACGHSLPSVSSANWKVPGNGPCDPRPRPRLLQGQRNLKRAVCAGRRGLLEIAKFYFYLLLGDDLNTPRCQIINRKEPAFGFCYQRRELRLFFSLTFFFFLTAQYLGWIPVQVITFCLPKFPCNSNWASCSSLPPKSWRAGCLASNGVAFQ